MVAMMWLFSVSRQAPRNNQPFYHMCYICMDRIHAFKWEGYCYRSQKMPSFVPWQSGDSHAIFLGSNHSSIQLRKSFYPWDEVEVRYFRFWSLFRGVVFEFNFDRMMTRSFSEIFFHAVRCGKNQKWKLKSILISIFFVRLGTAWIQYSGFRFKSCTLRSINTNIMFQIPEYFS